MTGELTGRRIVVPEGRELGQLIRMLEEYGAEAIPCPMIAIRDAPDAEPVDCRLMTRPVESRSVGSAFNSIGIPSVLLDPGYQNPHLIAGYRRRQRSLPNARP